VNVILRLFPAAWRDRYGDEFLALLDDQPPGRRRWLDIARCVVAAHLDRSALPSMEPTPSRGRAHLVAVLVLGLLVAGLAALFLGTASYSALRRAGDLLAPLLVIVPAASVAAAALALWRYGDRSMRAALPDIVVNAFLFSVLGLIAIATLTPQIGLFQQAPWIEPRPFVEVFNASTEASRVQALADMAGNAMLFMLLGFALALQRGAAGAVWIVGLATALGLVVELAQAGLGTGRPADSTDVIVRTIGAAVGYGAWRFPMGIGRSGRQAVRT